jgi:hypothetical protein
MLKTCIYRGHTPMDSVICTKCELFLEVCVPVVQRDGYAVGECELFLCESCPHDCLYKQFINL